MKSLYKFTISFIFSGLTQSTIIFIIQRLKNRYECILHANRGTRTCLCLHVVFVFTLRKEVEMYHKISNSQIIPY